MIWYLSDLPPRGARTVVSGFCRSWASPSTCRICICRSCRFGGICRYLLDLFAGLARTLANDVHAIRALRSARGGVGDTVSHRLVVLLPPFYWLLTSSSQSLWGRSPPGGPIPQLHSPRLNQQR